ncbi:hypothetical protein [Anaerococcus tetradius]|uniref:Uncharacterized protein n=1 Tax=Anaerococcus tetradius TaxID=33036 RepID=A0A133KDC0_9FIRM|nr:hypothetical protein [Anaerococcus tetradius]KWZ77445.1 hypothetical protein HMPREF3200_01438 [Anaerococcus tetradius]
MSENNHDNTTEYLTRLMLESKNLSNETPESLVKLYKDTYNQIKKSLKSYNDINKDNQKIRY